MECNKDEAVRAKVIAEKKMESKDFVGARKLALKAQQLYPGLDNIVQLLCVCDVHCSAESKMFGNAMDLYGILQIDQSADDAMIKKQYRKLALLLHPDKNKFPGAEAAFKLIGEAQRVLLDKEKRSFYDMKRKGSAKPVMPSRPAQQSSRNMNSGRQPRVPKNVTVRPNLNGKRNSSEQQQQFQSNGRPTFWTACPFCGVRYQYYKEVLGKNVKCQSQLCDKQFSAYDVNPPGVKAGSGDTQPGSARQEPQNQHKGVEGSQKVNYSSQSADRADKGGVSWAAQPSRKMDNKRKKRTAGSSESSASESSVDTDDDIEITESGVPGKCFKRDGDQNPRRSARNKQQVVYDENASDDDVIMTPPENARGSGLSSSATEERTKETEFADIAADASKESTDRVTSDVQGKGTVDNESKRTPETDPDSPPSPEFHDYPDPEFSDFEKLRDAKCFKVGEIWAVYDTFDAMPRFYARIKKISSAGFKLRITWLEADPDKADEKEWAEAGLPFSCGRFKLGDSEYTEDRLMFSHRMCWSKNSGKDSFRIHPIKGETWALFKNWDIKMSSSPESLKTVEYEFVEILCDYDDRAGIQTAYLVKLKGFSSLFYRKEGYGLQVPPHELLRFSHRVPSFKMTGAEREDVPEGSFELDPACLSTNLDEITNPKGTTMNESHGDAEGVAFDSAGAIPKEVNDLNKTQAETQENVDGDFSNSADSDAYEIPQPDVFEIPDAEFHNFDAMKAVDKFQAGQIWALYSDPDGLPRFYAQVKKVDLDSELKLHVAWLEACSLPSEIIAWKNKDMPICCGRFKVRSGTLEKYPDSASFSHLLKSMESTSKRNVFAMYPRSGEVWAMYKNWNPEMTNSDLKDSDYEIVEVVEEIIFARKALVLERVSGYNSVFKPQKKGNSFVVREVSDAQMLKFSHQIPSFRLTEEGGGNLRGFWELDVAAVPAMLL